MCPGKAAETFFTREAAKDMSRHIAATNCYCSYVKPTGAPYIQSHFYSWISESFLAEESFFSCAALCLYYLRLPTSMALTFFPLPVCLTSTIHERQVEEPQNAPKKSPTSPIPFIPFSCKKTEAGNRILCFCHSALTWRERHGQVFVKLYFFSLYF